MRIKTFCFRKRDTFVVAMLMVLPHLQTGCAGAPKAPQTVAPTQRLFYPNPPASPRIQFLTSLRQPQAWEPPQQSSFRKWIVGHRTDPRDAAGRFISPYGMAIDDHRLYICDVGGGRVHVIDLANRQYRTLTGTDITTPVNITIADDGTRYVCDTGESAVLVFDAQDRFVRRITGPDGWGPIDLAIHDDELFVADIRGGQIHVFNHQDELLRSLSQRGLGPDQLHGPTNLTFSPDGRLYVTDTYQQIVKIFDKNGRFLGSVGGPGSALGRFARPKGIAIDPHGHIYVTDSQWEVVQIFNPQGRLLLVFGGGGDGSTLHHMGMPAGILINRDALPHFRQYLAPGFEAEYLLFVINQFGVNKIAVYAYGQMNPSAESTPAGQAMISDR